MTADHRAPGVVRILFTGGGTAGHVTPNIALIEDLAAAGWDVLYVGSRGGIEQGMMADMGVAYRAIATGKLRRYFDWQNFIDPLRILLGFGQSLVLCLRYRPHVVFSKGGFVAVPLVIAAWLCRIPVIAHESDTTPGLANRLCYPFTRTICVNFEETAQYLPTGKVVVTGSPLRQGLREGDATRGRRFLKVGAADPLLLVFGGSLGATTINRCIRSVLGALCERFVVIHMTGKGNIEPTLASNRYLQFEYLGAGFGDVLAAADVVVSRAGANAVYELLALRKLHILVPLPLSASRGDQIDNARVFAARGMSRVIAQENLTGETLVRALDEAVAERAAIEARLADFTVPDSVRLITDLLRTAATATA
jgi:UDP-N-acetylglucosamine--N-acetylmuramyl-(pentapeptide) pyrophosphoryl-undecaprenol N-acetylglucosamine transferase